MMSTRSPTGGGAPGSVTFTAFDVTGSRSLSIENVDGHRRAGEVAMSVAAAFNLPTNVPWSFRDEKRARMLDQKLPLGSQIEPDAELVVIPKSHFG